MQNIHRGLLFAVGTYLATSKCFTEASDNVQSFGELDEKRQLGLIGEVWTGYPKRLPKDFMNVTYYEAKQISWVSEYNVVFRHPITWVQLQTWLDKVHTRRGFHNGFEILTYTYSCNSLWEHSHITANVTDANLTQRWKDFENEVLDTDSRRLERVTNSKKDELELTSASLRRSRNLHSGVENLGHRYYDSDYPHPPEDVNHRIVGVEHDPLYGNATTEYVITVPWATLLDKWRWDYESWIVDQYVNGGWFDLANYIGTFMSTQEELDNIVEFTEHIPGEVTVSTVYMTGNQLGWHCMQGSTTTPEPIEEDSLESEQDEIVVQYVTNSQDEDSQDDEALTTTTTMAPIEEGSEEASDSPKLSATVIRMTLILILMHLCLYVGV